MFFVQRYINRAYRTVATVASRGRAARAMHALTDTGAVRIIDRKGRIIARGKMIADKSGGMTFKAA